MHDGIDRAAGLPRLPGDRQFAASIRGHFDELFVPLGALAILCAGLPLAAGTVDPHGQLGRWQRERQFAGRNAVQDDLELPGRPGKLHGQTKLHVEHVSSLLLQNDRQRSVSIAIRRRLTIRQCRIRVGHQRRRLTV